MSQSSSARVVIPEDRRFYGRRKGKRLHAAQARALEDVLPANRIPLPEGSLAPASLFPFPVRDVQMEIGFGNGEHLLHLAACNPDIGFIGCEPFMNGVAVLCKSIQAQGLKNIRIWPDDARPLLDKTASGSLGRVFVLNSDPWPKKKHWKRRFIQTATLDTLHRLLKPQGMLRMSTDHPSLAAWLVEKTCLHPRFEWTARAATDWQTRPADMPETRYQKKGLSQGRPTVFLDFISKGDLHA